MDSQHNWDLGWLQKLNMLVRSSFSLSCEFYRHRHLIQYSQSLLIISPVTRRAATWPLVLELKFFLSNNVRLSITTEMCLHDHNSNNCTHSGNVCSCTCMVNNDYNKFRSFSPSLYYFILASNLHNAHIICMEEPTDF